MYGNETNMQGNQTVETPSTPYGRGPPPSNFSVLYKLVPLAVAIALTNGLVFALFASKKRLRTPSNLILLSLAVVDILTGTLCIPLMILILIPAPISSKLLSDVGYSVGIFHNFFAVAAAYHILVVTVEKYFAITRPLRHRMIGKETIGRVLAGVWLVATLVALLPVCWFAKRSSPTLTSAHAIFCFVAVFIVPYTFIIYAQVMTFRTATRTVTSGLCELVSRSRMASHRKCLYIFATMATIFAMCWLPWFTLMIIFSLQIVPPNNLTLQTCAEIFVVVRYLTSVVNPLLYTFLKRDFLNAFKELVGLRKRGLRRQQTATESITPRSSTQRRSLKKATDANDKDDKVLATESETMLRETVL